jgi:Glycosyl hydrolase family 12
MIRVLTWRRLTPVLASLGALALAAGPAHAATWSSTDAFGSWSNGGYELNNDVWGSGAGPQTIWANSYSNWGVWSDQPGTGGVKSYPHAARTVGVPINSLSRVSSSFNVSVPASGAYETAYDIWDSGYHNEIMLWMNKTGAVGPLGTPQGTVSVGGHTWTAYKGSNGSNAVFSLVRNGNTMAAGVDVLAVLKWMENTEHWFGNVTLGSVQFGYEITSSPGGANFVTNSYSVSWS